MDGATPLDIERIIAERSVRVRMQPIVSIRRHALIGVEALGQGLAPDGTPIAADLFFEAVYQRGRAADIDKVCLDVAFEQFVPMLAHQADLVLFLNVSRPTLTLASEGNDAIARLARKYGVDPRNVAVEIPEAEYDDIVILRRAIDCYNEAGFLVALDDVGVKQSNLDRVIALQPDILKIDRSLLQGIDHDTHKLEVVHSLVRLSERIGGWTIAEGIEYEREALTLLGIGGDLMQGYYFGVPGTFDTNARQHTIERIDGIAHGYKSRATEHFFQRRDAREFRLACMREAVQSVEIATQSAFDMVIGRIVEQFPNVQSACVLDTQGVQISDTSWRAQNVVQQKTIIFYPPTRGTDHSLKEYVYLLEYSATGIYETAPYVPLPTQQLCVTLSCSVRDADGIPRILCLHMDTD